MSLTKRIVGLMALALVPALAIQGYNEYALRTARGAAVRSEAMRTARGVAADLGRVRARGPTDPRAAVRAAGDPKPGCPEPARPISRRVVDKVPGSFFFGVADPDGRIRCNTLGSSPGAYTVADRSYFQEAMRTGGFAVGEVVTGRVTGRPTIQFALAIPGVGRRGPDGIVITSIDLSYLAARQAAAGLPPDAVLTVADRRGTVLLRLPGHDDWVGKALPPPFWEALTRHRGDVADLPGLNGGPRITAVAETGPGGLDSITVSVGVSPATAFADIDAATRRGLVLIGLGAALAIAAALLAGRAFIRQPVQRLIQTAAAWRAGALDARSGLAGPGEFGQLGEAFDAMAAALQTREGELRAEIARSRRLQERQTLMLHELNHRVRNTLATVQSLVRQRPRDDDGGERLEGRILALSKTHDLLARDDWGGASLRAVLENAFAPFEDATVRRFALDGPDLELLPRYVLALGMTIHELTTNAAKYGALADRERVGSTSGGASPRRRRHPESWPWNGGRAGDRPWRRPGAAASARA